MDPDDALEPAERHVLIAYESMRQGIGLAVVASCIVGWWLLALLPFGTPPEGASVGPGLRWLIAWSALAIAGAVVAEAWVRRTFDASIAARRAARRASGITWRSGHATRLPHQGVVVLAWAVAVVATTMLLDGRAERGGYYLVGALVAGVMGLWNAPYGRHWTMLAAGQAVLAVVLGLVPLPEAASLVGWGPSLFVAAGTLLTADESLRLLRDVLGPADEGDPPSP